MGCSSSQTAPASFPQGAALQEQAAPMWVPHGVTSPARIPALAWAPLSRGLQILPGACSSTDSPRGHSFFQASTCSSVGSLPWAAGGWISAPTWTSMGCRGHNLPHHGLHHELQGKTLCCSILSTSSPSFFTDLGVCRVVSLTSSHSSLSTAVFPQFFSPFLNMLSQRHYHHADWLGLGQQRIHHGDGWHWLYQTWGKLLAASHRSHRYKPPRYQNLATQTQILLFCMWGIATIILFQITGINKCPE